MRINSGKDFPMIMPAGQFLNQSFGEMVVYARIAVLKKPTIFQAQPPAPGYTNAVGASGNLR
jgi:hypothetical protein